MSLKPPKKSDLGKDWLSGRRDNKKHIHPEYHLIVTEGTKTEPQYFDRVRELINARYRNRLQLEVFGEGDNTVSLFDRAKRRAECSPNGYKHVWVVYDTDDFPAEHINIVPELCKKNSTPDRQYHAVWSNQCIELWFLLHFSYMQSDLHRDGYFPKLDEVFHRISAGKYYKNRDDIFDILHPYMDTALENAKRLMKENKGKTPAKSAPGTMVFEMMEKFKPYL